MYSTHQAKIGAYGRASPDNMAHVLKFVIITIRNPLYNVSADLEQVGEDADSFHAIAWGYKGKAINEIEEDKHALYAQAEEIWYHATSEREAFKNLLGLFTGVTGLGLAKAGFACQLLYGVGGCIDSHNLERFDIKPTAIKAGKLKNAKTFKTRDKHLENYVDLVDRVGGCASLWDGWCTYLADKNPSVYRNGEHVSAIHCEALGI